MLSRLRSQTGQTAAEYVGGLLLVAVVIAAVALTDLGGRIEYHARILVCRIAGGTDCEATAGNPDAPELSECVVRASDRAVDGSVKVLVFKFEGGVKGIYEVAADGTTTVTLQADAGAGLEFSTPGVKAGDGDVQASSPKGEFSVTGKGEFARAWKFKSEDDANSFIHHMVDKVVAEADPIPDFLQSADDYDPPKQFSDTIYGGIDVEGSYSAGGGGAYAGAEGGIEAGLGATYAANGDTTYFFKAKASASGKAGLAFAGGFGASADGEVIIGITYDKSGKEKTMSVKGTGSVTGGLNISGDTEDLSGLMGDIEKASFSGGSQQGGRIEFDSELDLTDPENLRAARAFIDGKDPDTGQPVDLVTATTGLYDRFDKAGKTNARLYDLSSDEAGIDVDAGVLGFSLKYSSHDANLKDAWFDPGPGGFQHWYDCAAAGAKT
jgi:hypothetical protein